MTLNIDSPMSDYEAAHKAMADLVREWGDGDKAINEAETRFQIIDRLLCDCLQWPRATIHVERSVDDTYSDYEAGNPPRVVIEAKRAGVAFQLPAGWTKPQASLQTLAAASGVIFDAVAQVLGYAQQRGIPIAGISNGHSMILCLGSRSDGTPPTKGSALVFQSLRSILERFVEFWDALSPAGVAAGNLLRRLGQSLSVPAPPKLSSQIVGYPGYKNRNPISATLKILGGLFIEDIVRDPRLEDEFLAATFCKTGALSQYSLLSREILRARYSTAFSKDAEVSEASATTKHGISDELRLDIVAAGLKRRPVLLVGDVGAGKSTFIRHLIRVDARADLQDALVFYVDFGTKPAVAEQLGRYISEELLRQARDTYNKQFRSLPMLQSIYRREIKEFEDGVYSRLRESDRASYDAKEADMLQRLCDDTDAHLQRCFEHSVKNEKRRVVIFLDNIDQRPPSFQEQAFLIAQSMASNWPVTVFLALRPETFAESRSRGTLTAYQPRVFTISPARVDTVIGKRLSYARDSLETTGRVPGLSPEIGIQSESLLTFLDVLIQAFDQSRELTEFLDNMSSGNLRVALDYVMEFIGSGHVDSRKIVEAHKNGGYRLPLHEFVRAVIHRDAEYYDPAAAYIPNVYDISSADGREHFLMALLIRFTESKSQLGGSEGYVAREEVLSFAQALGFTLDASIACIGRCMDKRLLSTPSGLSAPDFARIRVTSAGVYVVRKLIGTFAYIDAVSVDTPVVDPQWRARIMDARTLDQRLDRGYALVSYLTEQWSKVPAEALAYIDWPKVAEQANGEILGIRNRQASW